MRACAAFAAVGLVAGLGLSAIFYAPERLERQYARDQWFDGRYNFKEFRPLLPVVQPSMGSASAPARRSNRFQLGVIR